MRKEQTMSMISEQVEELRLMAEMFVNGEPYGNLLRRAANTIEMLSEKARADRPQGEWKSVKASIYPYGYDVECSVCGHRMGSSFGYKFCPMCGASMKGADDEDA